MDPEKWSPRKSGRKRQKLFALQLNKFRFFLPKTTAEALFLSTTAIEEFHTQIIARKLSPLPAGSD